MKCSLLITLMMMSLAGFTQSEKFEMLKAQIKADAISQGYIFIDEESAKTNFELAIAFETADYKPGSYIFIAIAQCDNHCPLQMQAVNYVTGTRKAIEIDNTEYEMDGNIFMASALEVIPNYFDGRVDFWVNDEILGIYYYTHAMIFKKND